MKGARASSSQRPEYLHRTPVDNANTGELIVLFRASIQELRTVSTRLSNDSLWRKEYCACSITQYIVGGEHSLCSAFGPNAYPGTSLCLRIWAARRSSFPGLARQRIKDQVLHCTQHGTTLHTEGCWIGYAWRRILWPIGKARPAAVPGRRSGDNALVPLCAQSYRTVPVSTEGTSTSPHLINPGGNLSQTRGDSRA